MLSFTARGVPKTLLKHTRKTYEPFVYLLYRFFSEEPFKKPRLWSDRGRQTLYSNDNIGGWQNDDSCLLNRVDLNTIKYQSLKGFKGFNEDRFQVTELSADTLFLGVFDGHGGSFVVDFVRNNLHLYVKKFLDQGRCSLTTALRRGFIDCDVALARELDKIDNKEQTIRSGSTATVAVLKNGEELVVASVGDSRAILCREGVAHLLTKDHTPSSTDEKNRVLANRASVETDGFMTPRVNGRLSMTRCFGNFDLKPFGVIAVPEIQTLTINQDTDSFLALITDGISAVMNTDQTVNILNGSLEPEESVEMLTTCAVQFGSEDDVTVILLPFRSFGMRSFEGNQYNHSLTSFRSGLTKYM
ncbi:protein phosphatase 1K, mitochondrial-like [Dendronephthya gigantea]|uniref:protein phosphatase 1K, mitochondrial-like n=1 Tax=Dendronephthya gigantea TaxID=151771 RepID=UPI001069CD85|nr:protein phosphatase 1K, mitochondrial-like [Dendronephthya gigantea]